ncbi:MAG TPA: TIGR02266 family protein [Polyangiaceae bacterium]|nr:TIGR02266 family protein [Polyangiaceae bacterium]
MAQDTRKDPRAKVLTMTVRYKSATLDEFIEHHSYDISRGGMFIKTPSPFPPGTLLKFEVKIAEDQRLMQGVGRVVWKREPPDANGDRPAGMGVKFIKIDEQSKKLIDQLVSSRGEGVAAFEQGEAPLSAAPPPSAAPFQEKAPPPSEHARPVTMRKATMIGLGAMGDSDSESAPGAASGAAFFPQSSRDDKPMPAPEDRTVMKQAAELLEDALREAGGSMDEVGDTRAAASVPARASDEFSTPSVPDSYAHSDENSAPAALRDSPVPVARSESRPERVVASTEPRASARAEQQRRSEPARAASVSERARRPSVSPLEESAGGGGKIIALLLGVAAAAALVFFLTRQKPGEPAAEPAPAEPTAAQPAAPPATEPAAAVAQPEPRVAADAAAEPSAAADAGAAATEPTPPVAAPAEKPAPKPKPEIKVRPVPRPKPKAVAPPPEEPRAEEPSAEPKTEPAAKPAPAPKPKPAPGEESDNPY